MLVVFLTAFPSLFIESQKCEGAAAEARVIEVNDGDTVTLQLNGGVFRTRLIGIDAPELGQEPWGRIAKERLITIIKETDGKVSVETDVEKYDKYDRLLAYLWSKKKMLINESMLLDGYAVLFTIQPNTRFYGRLKKAEAGARKNAVGIWGRDGLKQTPHQYKQEHPRTK